MTVRVAAAAEKLVVDLAVVKERLRIDHDDEDASLEALIRAATLQVEAATQRRFMTQTLQWVLPCWRPVLRFPVAPVSTEGLTVIYAAPNGSEQQLDLSTCKVGPSGETISIRPKAGEAFPSLDLDAGEPIVIEFVAGADEAPDDAAEAVLRQVQYLYDTPDWPIGPSGLPLIVEAAFMSLCWS